jgi:hypothetical protein
MKSRNVLGRCKFFLPGRTLATSFPEDPFPMEIQITNVLVLVSARSQSTVPSHHHRHRMSQQFAQASLYSICLSNKYPPSSTHPTNSSPGLGCTAEEASPEAFACSRRWSSLSLQDYRVPFDDNPSPLYQLL